TVEVVDEIATHECLQGLIDFGQLDSFGERFVAVHVDIDLRNDGEKGGVDAGDLGPLLRGLHKFGHVCPEEGEVFACAVFEHEVEAAGGADTLNGRRRKGEGNCAGHFGGFVG